MEDKQGEKKEKKDKKKLYIGMGIILVILISVFIFWRGQNNSTTDAEKTENVLPKTENLKKVENTVKVSAVRVGDGKRVKFTVTNIPDKYKKIEYQFVYQTGSGGLQGSNSSPSTIKNNRYEKEILLELVRPVVPVPTTKELRKSR
jgi:hypothetical protein